MMLLMMMMVVLGTGAGAGGGGGGDDVGNIIISVKKNLQSISLLVVNQDGMGHLFFHWSFEKKTHLETVRFSIAVVYSTVTWELRQPLAQWQLPLLPRWAQWQLEAEKDHRWAAGASWKVNLDGFMNSKHLETELDL